MTFYRQKKIGIQRCRYYVNSTRKSKANTLLIFSIINVFVYKNINTTFVENK